MLLPSRSGQPTLKSFSFLFISLLSRYLRRMTRQQNQHSQQSKTRSQPLYATSRRSTSIVLAGDFNRHHPMWGGNHIQPRFIEDASDLITFFQANELHSCLPRGTATYWSLNDPGRNSTIDQTVTDRPDLLIKCHLYHENYGSDHRATYSEWNLQAQHKPTTKARKAYERADWNKLARRCSGKSAHGKKSKHDQH